MEQGTLAALLAAEAPRLLPARRSLEILRAVSEALFPLHAAGTGHGPFGTESVLLGDETRLSASPAPQEEYVAPELREGGEPSPASDAFAYATLAHRLLAGADPEYDAAGVPLPAADRHPGFPTFAGGAIARALQPDPVMRPLPKVLLTLLEIVPADRWPSATPGAAEEPEPAPQPEPEPEPEAPVATGHAVPQIEWQPDTPTTEHAVPHIDWSYRDPAADEAPRIEWSADGDPTRPADQIPEISWSPDEPEQARPEPLSEVLETEPLVHEVPTFEPLAETVPEDQISHRSDRRVRRKRRERSGEQTQRIVLVAILVVLVLAGVVYLLTHKHAPTYDPQLQGASRTLSHLSSLRA